MPETTVVLFQEKDRVPFLEWFDELPVKVQDKCRVRLERLASLGHELRRPEADYLRDGIYELRIRHQSVNYRILYFFHERGEAVVSHGLQKERAVPPKEIEAARRRQETYRADPEQHAYEE